MYNHNNLIHVFSTPCKISKISCIHSHLVCFSTTKVVLCTCIHTIPLMTSYINQATFKKSRFVLCKDKISDGRPRSNVVCKLRLLRIYQRAIFTPVYTHAHIHTWHIHITLGDSRRHKHTYTYTHAQTNISIQTYMYTNVYPCMHTDTQIQRNTHVTCIHMHVSTCIRILYQLMMREPLAIHFNGLTIKLVPNHKLKIWVCIFWIFDGLHIREN